MNFSNIAKDLGEQTLTTVKYILGLGISTDRKKQMLAKLFRDIGFPFYDKIFRDASELFDSGAIGTTGFKDPDDQIGRLATKIVQNHNLGRTSTPAIVRTFYDSVSAQALDKSFKNAKSLGKHPTLTRILRGETCKWCRSMTGTFVNPEGEMFARHENCDCLFITKGYNSRNGVVNNYRKGK